jgi:hypothetical protein
MVIGVTDPYQRAWTGLAAWAGGLAPAGKIFFEKSRRDRACTRVMAKFPGLEWQIFLT